MEDRLNFSAYYGRVLSRCVSDALDRIWWFAIITICAMAASFLLVKWGLLPSAYMWPTVLAHVYPALGVFLMFGSWNLVRSPWKVHNELLQRVCDEQRDSQARNEAAHAETQRRIKDLTDELTVEREKNGKPEITVCVTDVSVVRLRSAIDSRTGDVITRTVKVYITVTVQLRNSRGMGTVDSCTLAIDHPSGLVPRNLPDYPETIRASIVDGGVTKMEPNVLVPKGQTVTRYALFVVDQKTTVAVAEPGTRGAIPDPDPFEDTAAFSLAVIDSYGTQWESVPWESRSARAV